MTAFPVLMPIAARVGNPTVNEGAGARDELLVVMGQSNALASGISSVPSEVAAIDTNRVKIWTGSAFAGYVAATNSEPTGAFSTKWGPEAQYAIRWLADHPTGTLYIVKRAVSGTAISTWQAGQTNFDNGTAWVSAARSALAGIALNKYLLWAQGESDAIVDQTLADAYQAALTTFLASARSVWGVTKAAVMRIYNANMTYRATVRAAQKAVCLADVNSFMVNTDDQTLVDTYHYNNAGVLEIGTRMYDAIRMNAGFEYEAASSLPPMTGAAAPSGYAVTASSEFSATFPGWKAFDQSLIAATGRWATALGLSSATLVLQVPSPIKIGAFTYADYGGGATTDPPNIVLAGSDDGVSYTTIFSVSGLSWSNGETKLFEIPTASRAAYKYHRWSFSGVANGYSALEIVPLQAA